MSEKYFGFVYLWYDTLRDKLCIGSHFGSKEDGYTTSTGHCKFAIKKRPDTFVRIILYYHKENNRKTLLEKEQMFLDVIPTELLGNYFYNLKKFASGGGIIGRNLSEKTKNKISLAQKNKKRNQTFNTSVALLSLSKSKKCCKYCNKVMDIGNYSKYHDEKCKLNPNIDPNVLEKRKLHARKAAAVSVLKRKSK